MPRLSCLVLALCLGVAPLMSAQEKEKTHPQESLETAIPQAIKLLEDKKYKQLIDDFVVPEDLKKMKDSGQYETVVKKFGEGEKAKTLLEVLKSVQKLKPELSEEATTATFKPPKADDGASGRQRPIVFKKIEKRWYIAN